MGVAAWVAVVVGLGWGSASLAFAQPETAETSTGGDVEAREAFEQGREAYEDGRFEEALVLFRRSHRLSGNPVLLYNVALAADRLRRDREALDAYRSYLDEVDDARHRPSVEARIAILEDAIARGEAAAQPPPAAPLAPISPAPAGPGPLPWIVVATGGAFLAGGTVLVILALGDVSSVEDAPLHSRWGDYESAANRAPVLSTVGFVLGGIGLVALGGGLLWALGSGGTDEGGERVRASIGLGTARLEVDF